MSMSPTQLSLRELRKRDDLSLVEVVERWNPHARIRQDLFGLIDIIAIGPDITLGVQTTSATNFAARCSKLRDDPSSRLILAAGWQLWVHGWAKKRGRWELTRQLQFTL